MAESVVEATRPGQPGTDRSRHAIRGRHRAWTRPISLRQRADALRAAEPSVLEGDQLGGMGNRLFGQLRPGSRKRSHSPDARDRPAAEQFRRHSAHAAGWRARFAFGDADAAEAEGGDRSLDVVAAARHELGGRACNSRWRAPLHRVASNRYTSTWASGIFRAPFWGDRKSTRLNSSHMSISYAVFCLKKKKHELIKCLLL